MMCGDVRIRTATAVSIRMRRAALSGKRASWNLSVKMVAFEDEGKAEEERNRRLVKD
jgi:hypothetical protein